jgi:hypothetical protein
MDYEVKIMTTGKFENNNYSIFARLPEYLFKNLQMSINDPELDFIEIETEEAEYHIRKDKIIAMKVTKVK